MRKPQYLPLFAFAALGIIWGSNFIYMKMATNLISPMQTTFFRVFFGFTPVVLYALYRKALHWKHLKHFPHFIVMGILATTLYYYCFVKGTSLLLSGIAGAISGSIPLFSFLLAITFIPQEKCTLTKILGIIIGFIGVAMIARPTESEIASSNIQGILYIAIGSLSVGASFVYAKKFIIPLKLPAEALTTYQLGTGFITLLLITDFHNTTNILTNAHATIGLIVGLGLLGTGIAYIIYYYIIEKFGAVSASSVTYIPPVVALLIGVIIAKEPITLLDYLATAMIFLGVYMLNTKRD
ncbi:DMT family transporter [Planctomycetota bacterium]|nr:DMT family transporter [Planctomycetota bacterium]